VCGRRHHRLVDDRRLGSVFRSVRIQKRWRQEDLASRAGISRGAVSRLERGHLERLRLDQIRRTAHVLDIRLDLTARWHGGDLDRLLNARHSALQEQVMRMLGAQPGWTCEAEVTFSIYGERGSIDVLGWHAGRRAALVIELKTEIIDPGGLVAQVDRYRRLVRQVERDRGADVAVVGCWVIVADTPTNRRRVGAHRAMLRASLPLDARAVSRWLNDPRESVSGLSFLSYDPAVSTIRNPGAVKRVRNPKKAGGGPTDGVGGREGSV